MDLVVRQDSRDGKLWPYLSVVLHDPAGAELIRIHDYAAWFRIRLCWDADDRFWIESADTGTDVLAATPAGWRRHRWMPDTGEKSILDAIGRDPLMVIDWEVPPPLRRTH